MQVHINKHEHGEWWRMDTDMPKKHRFGKSTGRTKTRTCQKRKYICQ